MLGEGERIAGAVFLQDDASYDEAYETDEDVSSRALLETTLDWPLSKHMRKIHRDISDDDPLVPISDAEIFKDKLGAELSSNTIRAFQ